MQSWLAEAVVVVARMGRNRNAITACPFHRSLSYNFDHVPFRFWRKQCAKSRGKENGKPKKKVEERRKGKKQEEDDDEESESKRRDK